MFCLKKLLPILGFLALVLIIYPQINPVLAWGDNLCTSKGIQVTMSPSSPVPENSPSITFTFSVNGGPLAPGTYKLGTNGTGFNVGRTINTSGADGEKVVSAADQGPLTLMATPANSGGEFLSKGAGREVWLDKDGARSCQLPAYDVGFDMSKCQPLIINPPDVKENESFRIYAVNAPAGNWGVYFQENGAKNLTRLKNTAGNDATLTADNQGNGNTDIAPLPLGLKPGTIMLYDSNKIAADAGFCKKALAIQAAGNAQPRPLPPPGPPPGGPGGQGAVGVGTSASGISCDPKTGDIPGVGGVSTAIGCIPTDPQEFVAGVLKFALAAGGGIALLLFIYGAFQMITSAGNAEGVKKGHEQMTSAIMGLLLIIFSVLLLQIIGVDILNLPDFIKP